MDNRYWKEGCPPLMSDGRFVTSYVDSDIMVQFIRHVNDLKSSQDFKNFMIKNAGEIMEKERSFLTEKNTCEVDGKCGSEIEGFGNTGGLGEINVKNYSDNRTGFSLENYKYRK